MLFGEMTILISMYKMYKHVENSPNILYTFHFLGNYYYGCFSDLLRKKSLLFPLPHKCTNGICHLFSDAELIQ